MAKKLTIKNGTVTDEEEIDEEPDETLLEPIKELIPSMEDDEE